MSRYVPAFEKETLAEGSMRRVMLEGNELVVIRMNDTFYALEDRCSHEDFPLSEGWIDDGCIFCSMHGAKFDIPTGEYKSPPAFENVRSYPVRIQDGRVEIDLE